MAKSLKRGAPASASSPGASSASNAESDAELYELIGNQALQDELSSESTREKQGDDWYDWLNPFGWFEAQDDFDSLWESLIATDAPDTVRDLDAPTISEVVDGPALEDESLDEVQIEEAVDVVHDMEDAIEIYEEEGSTFLDLASRPEEVLIDQKGALIGHEDILEIRSAVGEDASIIAEIPNGTPVRIVQIDSGWLEVAFRRNGQEEFGWVSQAFFSDQPSLFMDKLDPRFQEDYTWTYVGPDQINDDMYGTDVQQGGLADCYFIAAMNAVGTANPDFLKESIQYDESSGMYRVRFFEESGYDRSTGQRLREEVWIEVDGFLPTKGESTKGAYASAAAGKGQWGALIEKAYAQWKGGYDVIGDGGYGDQAMTELTGQASSDVDSSRMSEEDCLNFFIDAEAKGLAVYCGSLAAFDHEVQTPLKGSESGPYTGKLDQIHEWNNIDPGSLRIEDAEGNVASARDTGRRGDDSSALTGRDVKDGQVTYEKNTIEIEYKDGKAPAKAEDLQVHSKFGGMLYPAKQVIGWHGYSFDKVVDGTLIQLYNPWGSYQPKPLTPAEFLTYYNGISTVQVPQAEGKK